MPRVRPNDKNMKPQIGVYSFADTTPASTGQFEFDVSKFRDPMGQKQFVNLNGTHPDVRKWVAQDPRVGVVVQECMLLADDLVKAKSNNGGELKSVCDWLSISFKDHHGKWTSPAITEIVAEVLSDAGYNVVVHHGVIPEEKVWTAPF